MTGVRIALRLAVTVIGLGVVASCAGCGSSAANSQSSPSASGVVSPSPAAWKFPAGAVALAVRGRHLPPREGTIDSAGDLISADGSRHVLGDGTRAVLAQWLADPGALSDLATRVSCDLRADAAFLEVTLRASSGTAPGTSTGTSTGTATGTATGSVSVAGSAAAAPPVRLCVENLDHVVDGAEVSGLAALLTS